MTTLERINPTMVPRKRDERITLYYSYIKHLIPWLLVKPIALRQPYSQIFSLMFWVVDIKSKKKASIKAIAPTTATNI